MEWEKEPNFLEWYSGDVHCMIKRSPHLGHLCGYVGVDKLHPLYDVHYDDLEVHGGITYHGKNIEGMKETMFYFGFDCAHYGDLSPYMGISLNQNATYKNIDYVKKEVKHLANQLYYYQYIMKAIAGDEMPNFKKICPVCETEWRNNHAHIYCPNGCYSYEMYYKKVTVKVFDKEFLIDHDMEEDYKRQLLNKIRDAVIYWRTDDRYVTEILARTK